MCKAICRSRWLRWNIGLPPFKSPTDRLCQHSTVEVELSRQQPHIVEVPHPAVYLPQLHHSVELLSHRALTGVCPQLGSRPTQNRGWLSSQEAGASGKLLRCVCCLSGEPNQQQTGALWCFHFFQLWIRLLGLFAEMFPKSPTHATSTRFQGHSGVPSPAPVPSSCVRAGASLLATLLCPQDMKRSQSLYYYWKCSNFPQNAAGCRSLDEKVLG